MALNRNRAANGFGDVATGNMIARTLTQPASTQMPRNRAPAPARPAMAPGGTTEPDRVSAQITGDFEQTPNRAPQPVMTPAQSGATMPTGDGFLSYWSDQAASNAPAAKAKSGVDNPTPADRGYVDNAVSGRVDAIIAKDSPLMKRAATRGFQTANRRGLGNSSMAGQAAQLSVLDAATPIATADAQDRLTRDMTGDELANRLETTRMNNETSLGVAGISAEASRYSTDAQTALSLKLADINNRHDLTMQEKDQLAKVELAKLGFAHEDTLAEKDIAARYGLQSQDIAAREKLAQMGIDAEAQQGVLNRAFQADQQSRDLASRLDLANLDITSREKIVVTQLEAEAAQKELDRALQLNLGDKEIAFRREELTAKLAAAQQERLAASLTDLSGQRMNATAASLGDPKTPAGARNAVQQSINDQYQSTVNYLQNLYGVGISNATPSLNQGGNATLAQVQAQYSATQQAIQNDRVLSPEAKAEQLANLEAAFKADMAKFGMAPAPADTPATSPTVAKGFGPTAATYTPNTPPPSMYGSVAPEQTAQQAVVQQQYSQLQQSGATLTPEQKAQEQSGLASQYNSVAAAVNADTTLSPEQKAAKLQQIETAYRADLARLAA